MKIKSGMIAVIAALLTVGTIVAGLFLSIDLDYCKQILSYDGGIAAIEESGIVTSIVCTDQNGRLKHMIKTLNTNYLTANVRNFRTLFEGDDKELYVMCKRYREDQKDVWEVYRCNFRFGILQKQYTVDTPEGYIYVTGTIPVIKKGKLYLQYQMSDYQTLVTFAFSKDGKRTEIARVVFDDHLEIERCKYTDQGIASLVSTQGVYLDDEKIYSLAPDGKGLLVGIAADEENVSLIDLGIGRQVFYNMTTKELHYEDIGFTDFESCQSIRTNADGGFCSPLEEENKLVGMEWKDGRERIYRNLYRKVDASFLVNILLGALLVSLFYRGLFRLLFIRKLKNEKEVRFVSIGSLMTAFSVIITVIAVIVIAKRIYGNMTKQNDVWIRSDCQSSAKYISSTMFYMTAVHIREDGLPELEEEIYEKLEGIIRGYQESLNGGKLGFEYDIMIQKNDEVYCIYSKEFSGTMKAAYAVSNYAIEEYKKSLSDLKYRYFEDKRSVGILEYTLVTYYVGTIPDQEYIPVTVGVVSDGYEQRIVYIRQIPDVIRIVGILSIVLLIAVNLALRLVLRGVRKLGKALDIYVQTKDYHYFDVKDTTEIGKTAHALKAMSAGLEIHEKDIRDSNISYQRLISTGILKLLEKDSITQVEIGDYRKVTVYCFRITFDPMADLKQQMKTVMAFVEDKKGVLNDWNKEYLLAVFRLYPGMEKEILKNEFLKKIQGRFEISLKISKGEIEVGSAGTDQHAYLTAVGELIEECR